MKLLTHIALVSATSFALFAATPQDPVQDFADIARPHFATGKSVLQVFDKEILASTKPVVVKFFMIGCGPCDSINPAFHKIAESFKGKASFVTLDVIKFTEIAEKYGIKRVPAFIIFWPNKKIETIKGSGNVSKVGEFLTSFFSKKN